ncbi:unnamed protein product [Effrenium voratum]|nr:unnamed protein product [Effrenium voratum]
MRECLQKKVIWKDASSIDPVTATDKENELRVTEGLRAAFPSHRIVGEESATADLKILDEPTWIIDPIDGTTNFVYAIKLSCVSIGLCMGGEPVVGVVYDPYADELFVAAKGEGLGFYLRSCKNLQLDSRCLHCNTPASALPDRPRDELLRACVYVCMTPKAWCPEKALEQRRKGYELRVTTSHWPHRHVMGFGWAKAGRLCLEEAPLERRRLIG